MPGAQIREAIEKLANVLSDTPEKARIKTPSASATVEDGLKCRVTGPAGEMLVTDMPRGVGGGATAPSPGWLLKAALASCDATCIAMRAAQRGIEISRLEVTVSSELDNRGMLGLNDDVSPGLLALRVLVRIGAPDASREELTELVHWACAHAPVACTDLASARLEVQVE